MARRDGPCRRARGVSDPAVARHGAPRRARPRLYHPADAAVDGRAVRLARRADRGAPAPPAARHAARAPGDRAVRHPQSARGDHARRSDRAARAGADPGAARGRGAARARAAVRCRGDRALPGCAGRRHAGPGAGRLKARGLGGWLELSRVSELWPWLALAGLGAFHGVNPAMGWLFAVALGMNRGSRAVVWRSLVPITLGHAASVAV